MCRGLYFGKSPPPPPLGVRGKISSDVIWGKNMKRRREKRENVKEKGIKRKEKGRKRKEKERKGKE
jgi:hypothetical protein